MARNYYHGVINAYRTVCNDFSTILDSEEENVDLRTWMINYRNYLRDLMFGASIEAKNEEE